MFCLFSGEIYRKNEVDCKNIDLKIGIWQFYLFWSIENAVFHEFSQGKV
jgi:hypothetical protein